MSSGLHHGRDPLRFDRAFAIGIALNLAYVAVEAALRALPGVEAVHDLHVWSMSTRVVALTAHLVMPDGGTHDTFLRHATEELYARFDIDHVRIQVVRAPITKPWCAQS